MKPGNPHLSPAEPTGDLPQVPAGPAPGAVEGAAYRLTDLERGVAVSALQDYRMETERYLYSSKFEPCHPDCLHCAPKVAHFAEIRADLERRWDTIVNAIAVLGGSS